MAEAQVQLRPDAVQAVFVEGEAGLIVTYRVHVAPKKGAAFIALGGSSKTRLMVDPVEDVDMIEALRTLHEKITQKLNVQAGLADQDIRLVEDPDADDEEL